MKPQEYAEHLIRVIRHETQRGEYLTASILADNLSAILKGLRDEQQEKHDSTMRAIAKLRKVTVGGATIQPHQP